MGHPGRAGFRAQGSALRVQSGWLRLGAPMSADGGQTWGTQVVFGHEKSRPGGRLFSFLLYKFRIPSWSGFTARFWRVFWRGNGCVSTIVTFVMRSRYLTGFPHLGGECVKGRGAVDNFRMRSFDPNFGSEAESSGF